jgi:trans-L-3-hydroxyproline dehydratase
MHNEGYSTMCGHAVIALGRYAVDRGIVPVREPETALTIQCPCGPVEVAVEVQDGRSGRVRFRSVPAFAAALEVPVEIPPWGLVTVDIAYGGAFYALAAADQFGLDVRRSPVPELVAAATAVTGAVREAHPLHHPDDADLAFLYGTILTDGADAFAAAPTANICVFAGAQVDRSPTGSGVSARLAAQHRRGQIGLDRCREFESVTGAIFSGTIVEETTVGDLPGVIVEVGGEAHYTGEARFTAEPADPLGSGFLLS